MKSVASTINSGSQQITGSTRSNFTFSAKRQGFHENSSNPQKSFSKQRSDMTEEEKTSFENNSSSHYFKEPSADYQASSIAYSNKTRTNDDVYDENQDPLLLA